MLVVVLMLVLTFRLLHLLPFFLAATTLKAALLSSFGAGPFLATSFHPPLLLLSLPAFGGVPLGTGSMMPLSASLRRRMNSSAKRRPSSVCEFA
jgi:hypothetical protein